ncbi:MAG: hypothetical protein H6Q05_4811, partial [Acidobacteria bacterium]|nr:hypothetical protein [Acidobacteriota bacterium]
MLWQFVKFERADMRSRPPTLCEVIILNFCQWFPAPLGLLRDAAEQHMWQ